MRKNMGFTDRAIRIVIAVAVTVLYLTGVVGGTVGLVMIALSGVFLLTSVVSFCPLYSVFGISTATKKDALAEK